MSFRISGYAPCGAECRSFFLPATRTQISSPCSMKGSGMRLKNAKTSTSSLFLLQRRFCRRNRGCCRSKNRVYYTGMKNFLGHRLLFLYLAAFITIVGYGMVFPLLPFYAQHFGATPLQLGFLAAAFSITQFLAAPIVGRISDR